MNLRKIIVGNEIKFLETKLEEIPYKIEDRIIWYLEKQNNIVSPDQLMEGLAYQVNLEGKNQLI